MREKDIIEQLNKEISDIEVNDRVLNNVLLKMREAKREEAYKSTKKEKINFYKWLKPMTAVVACAVVMLVAIPFIGSNNTDPSPIGMYSSEQTPMSPRTEVKNNEVELDEVDIILGRNVRLPMKYEGMELEVVTLTKLQDNANTLIDMNYVDTTDFSSNILITVVVSENNERPIIDETLYRYKGIVADTEVDMTTNGEERSGGIYFAIKDVDYFIDYYNTDILEVEKIVKCIQADCKNKTK